MRASEVQESQEVGPRKDLPVRVHGNQKKMFPCSAMLEGEYGLSDICIGVPCIIGKNGIEEILSIDLTEAENTKLQGSAAAVRNTNALLEEVLN